MPKWFCLVPSCKNTGKNNKDKLFLIVPKNDPELREKWLRAAGRDPEKFSKTTSLYVCEDHFDLPNDMENWVQYKMMKSSNTPNRKFLKKGVVPHRNLDPNLQNVKPINSGKRKLNTDTEKGETVLGTVVIKRPSTKKNVKKKVDDTSAEDEDEVIKIKVMNNEVDDSVDSNKADNFIENESSKTSEQNNIKEESKENATITSKALVEKYHDSDFKGKLPKNDFASNHELSREDNKSMNYEPDSSCSLKNTASSGTEEEDINKPASTQTNGNVDVDLPNKTKGSDVQKKNPMNEDRIIKHLKMRTQSANKRKMLLASQNGFNGRIIKRKKMKYGFRRINRRYREAMRRNRIKRANINVEQNSIENSATMKKENNEATIKIEIKPKIKVEIRDGHNQAPRHFTYNRNTFVGPSQIPCGENVFLVRFKCELRSESKATGESLNRRLFRPIPIKEEPNVKEEPDLDVKSIKIKNEETDDNDEVGLQPLDKRIKTEIDDIKQNIKTEAAENVHQDIEQSLNENHEESVENDIEQIFKQVVENNTNEDSQEEEEEESCLRRELMKLKKT